MSIDRVGRRLWLVYLVAGLVVVVAILRLPEPAYSIVYDLVGLSAVVAILAGCACTARPAVASGTGWPAAWRCSSPATSSTPSPTMCCTLSRSRPGRRPLPDQLPAPGGGAARPDPQPHRRPGPVRADRRPDHHHRPRPAVMDLPDAADRLRHLADAGHAADLARLPAGRRAPAGRAGAALHQPGARGASYRLLGAALLLQLGADIVFAGLTAVGTYSGGLLDLGWMASYLCWGAAALHPSVRSLSEVAPARGVRVNRRRPAGPGPSRPARPGPAAVPGDPRTCRSAGCRSGSARWCCSSWSWPACPSWWPRSRTRRPSSRAGPQ